MTALIFEQLSRRLMRSFSVSSHATAHTAVVYANRLSEITHDDQGATMFHKDISTRVPHLLAVRRPSAVSGLVVLGDVNTI